MNKDIFSTNLLLSNKNLLYKSIRFNSGHADIKFIPKFDQLRSPKCTLGYRTLSKGFRQFIGVPSDVFASLVPSVQAAEAVASKDPADAAPAKTPALLDLPPGPPAIGGVRQGDSLPQPNHLMVFDEEIAEELSKETGWDRLQEMWNHE